MLIILPTILSLIYSKQTEVDRFFNKYNYHYQDICIGDTIHPVGHQNCEQRFKIIQPVLDAFNHPFSVLDIGACEGYFSFRISREYPATCHMIEGGFFPKRYAGNPSKLLQLCLLNKNPRVTLMHSLVDLPSLDDLAKHDHFDLVIAFLVIHQMAMQKHDKYQDYMHEIERYIEKQQNLGNYLLIETALDVGPEIDTYVATLCEKIGGVFLGEINRYKKGLAHSKGRFYLFKSKNISHTNQMISEHSFKKLGGVYKG